MRRVVIVGAGLARPRTAEELRRGAFAVAAPRPFAVSRRSIESSASWSDALAALDTGEPRARR
jgi:hypothetical protein